MTKQRVDDFFPDNNFVNENNTKLPPGHHHDQRSGLGVVWVVNLSLSTEALIAA